MQFFLCMGFLIPFTYGPGASYRELIAVAAAVPLMCALIFAWVPESPYHLLNKNKKQEALESLQWLRGYPERILMQSEITDILVSLCEIIFLTNQKISNLPYFIDRHLFYQQEMWLYVSLLVNYGTFLV